MKAPNPFGGKQAGPKNAFHLIEEALPGDAVEAKHALEDLRANWPKRATRHRLARLETALRGTKTALEEIHRQHASAAATQGRRLQAARTRINQTLRGFRGQNSEVRP